MQKQFAAFVESLRHSGLLDAEQGDRVSVWATAADADPQAIAKEIVQRGWLTAFQVKQFWKGQGGDLVLGQYVLIDRLGEGGMGEVFKARHRRMERDVALKVIRKERLDSAEAVKRFAKEIQAAAALAHENIVMAYDADRAGDRHFFAMEFVEGITLSKLVKDNGPMPVTQACDCIRQAALGLQHAFERGMVHRDIKPSNLLLGKNGVLKLLDMGLARLQESPTGEIESRITQEGLVIGTPDFLAPEQARNSRTADIRADIYSLGCTFFYLLCGHTPYQGGTPTEKMLRHTVDPTPQPTRVDVPPEIAAIVQKMMAKKVEDRFQTPAEVAFLLQPYSGTLSAPASGVLSRPLRIQSAASTANQDAAVPAIPLVDEHDPRTDSQFRLPPPRRIQPKPDRSRWNLPIAIAASAVAFCIVAGIVYWLVKRQADPSGPSIDKEFKNRHEMAFQWIPAGSFEMGSTEAEDEGPVHPVEIAKPFYMMTTEVTLNQFQAVMGRKPKGMKSAAEDLDVPATWVSRNEAKNFCEKLNADGAAQKPGWAYRLPTEAEWEYACRAGSKSRYSFGRDIGHEQALFGEETGKSPGKVARFPANAWGLHDMHGNAAEWVADMYDPSYYTDSPAQDPMGPTQRGKFVIRGGGFNDPPEACRSSRRRAEYPEAQLSGVGFRVVLGQSGK